MSEPGDASLEWMLSLRWIERAEIVWALVLPCALLAWAASMLVYAPAGTVTAAAVSHVLLALCALSCAPRGKLPVWCGLVLLSQVHLLVFAAMGFSRLALLAQIYLWLAVAVLVLCCLSCAHACALYIKLRGSTARDDYRWLLTTAPLPWRALFTVQLARLKRHEPKRK